MKEKIYVFDDEEQFSREWVNRLEKVVPEQFELIEINPPQFVEMIHELTSRQQLNSSEKYNKIELDEVSIFFIDYRLINPQKKIYTTGEEAAYLIRCFSKCNLIIGLNQFSENEFDLTLKGHPESYCDINLGSDQLDNVGLWKTDGWDFRPWYWPMIPDFLSSFKEKVERVKKVLFDEAITSVLQLEDIIKKTPRDVTGFLGNDPVRFTFHDFIMQSGNGLKLKDKQDDIEILANIAVSRVSKWIERCILPGQNFFVDAPHLVSRFPSLLDGDRKNVETWNRTTKFSEENELGITHDIIKDNIYTEKNWVSRRVWLWEEVSSNYEISEIKEPWKRDVVNYRFCEDNSSFLEKTDCREFIISSKSPWNRRYLRRVPYEGVDYRPRTFLL